jgi:glycosyltransferase involved in cell wall biosynthesis
MLNLRVSIGEVAAATSESEDLSLGSLSVAVCTRDRPDWCTRAVASVLMQLGPDDELIVVDQSDSDLTKEALARLGAGKPLRRLASSQRGLSAARNEAIAAAAYDTLVFIDDDCIPEAGWLEEWRNAWSRWSDPVGIAFGRVLRAQFDPAKGSIAGFEPNPGIHGRELFRKRAGAGGMGANMAVKRTAVRGVHGFDEALGSGGFFGAAEELDLAYRLVLSGHVVGHIETSMVRHHGFRPHSDGSALTLRYAFGTAAAFTKHARCGDLGAVSVLLKEIWDSAQYAGSQFVHRRRPLGLRGLISYLHGISAAFRWPMERQRRLFLPQPGQLIRVNPTITPAPLASALGDLTGTPKRQVVLFTSSYCMGGIEAHVIDLAGGLIHGGWNVALICSTLRDIEPLRREMTEMGVTVHAMSQASSPFHLFRRAWQMVEILRRYPGCIVHLHLQGESGGVLSLLAARVARVKAVVRTLHNPPVPPISRRHRLVVRLTDRLLDKVICVSPETRRAQEHEFKRDPRKSRIIPNGVDLSRFSVRIRGKAVRRELGILPDAPVIGTVARLEEERKGISEFVEMASAVARCWPQARFIVVGDGPLRPSLEMQVIELGLSKQFLFTGYRRDVPRLLAAIDVAVFPSSYEAGPYVMLEAMAMARPVVITPTGLAVDLIKPGVTGILVPFHDPAAMFLAVHQLLSDPEIATRMGQAGRQLVINGYSAETMVDSVVHLYTEVSSPVRSGPMRGEDQPSPA